MAGTRAASFSDANGYAIAQHASDYSPVTVQNPAHPGETIVVYANDFFQVWPPTPIGAPVPQQPLYQLNLQLITNSVTPFYAYCFLKITSCSVRSDQSFANSPALQVLFQGLAPGLVGVEQINFVVPANQASGNWALFFNSGSCADGSGRCSFYRQLQPICEASRPVKDPPLAIREVLRLGNQPIIAEENPTLQ